MIVCRNFEIPELCSSALSEPCKMAMRDVTPKYVRFSTVIGFVRIPNLCELPQEEKDELWHPEPGYSSSSSNRRTPKRMIGLFLCSSNRPADQDDGGEVATERGDDHCNSSSPSSLSSSSSKRRFPVDAVLTEQDYQRYEGSHDPDLMARIYGKCSAHGVARAHMRAKVLEADVRNYVLAKSRGGDHKRRRSSRGSIISRFLHRGPSTRNLS